MVRAIRSCGSFMNIRNLIDKLADTHILTKEELVYIIKNINLLIND